MEVKRTQDAIAAAERRAASSSSSLSSSSSFSSSSSSALGKSAGTASNESAGALNYEDYIRKGPARFGEVIERKAMPPASKPLPVEAATKSPSREEEEEEEDAEDKAEFESFMRDFGLASTKGKSKGKDAQ